MLSAYPIENRVVVSNIDITRKVIKDDLTIDLMFFDIKDVCFHTKLRRTNNQIIPKIPCVNNFSKYNEWN